MYQDKQRVIIVPFAIFFVVLSVTIFAFGYQYVNNTAEDPFDNVDDVSVGGGPCPESDLYDTEQECISACIRRLGNSNTRSCYTECDRICFDPEYEDPTENPTAECGDGEINQNSEQCEVGVPCRDNNQQCNTQTCECETIAISSEDPVEQQFCGDGNVDSTEECDPNASISGCNSGQICSSLCVCVSSANPPSSDESGINSSADLVILPRTGFIRNYYHSIVLSFVFLGSGLLLVFKFWNKSPRTH